MDGDDCPAACLTRRLKADMIGARYRSQERDGGRKEKGVEEGPARMDSILFNIFLVFFFFVSGRAREDDRQPMETSVAVPSQRSHSKPGQLLSITISI